MTLLRTWFLLACSTLAALPATAQEFFDNVVIVLDASGSMEADLGPGLTKMDGATTALVTVISNLPESTRVGVVVFGAGNVRDGWLHELGPRDDEALFASLKKLRPSGGTPLGHYVKMGADRLLDARNTEHGYGSYRLLVVTDGEANDAWKVESYTPDIVARGLSLDVIGVAMESDHTLKQYADSYRSADNPDALVQAVQEVFGEIDFSTDDTLAGNVFDELDGLPDEFALSLLQTLSYSGGNHPIGDEPPAPPTPPGEPVDDHAPSSAPPPSDCGTAPVPAGWAALGAALLLLRRPGRRRYGIA